MTSNMMNRQAAGLLLAAFHLDAMASGGPTAQDPQYVQECGSCHVPYPARMLPASSWHAILDGLDRHFDTDASLEPNVAADIRRYLDSHARREPAQTPSAPVLRISQTRWFRHEHDDVPGRTWAAVKSPANCAACHPGADQGRFSEHDIHLPNP